MNKKVKNIIMIIIALLLIVAIAFTIKESKGSTVIEMNGNAIEMNGEVPEKPEGETNALNIGETSEGNTPPEKPNGEGSNIQSEKTDGENTKAQGEGNTPPEKPDGEEGSEPPEKPEGDANSKENDKQMPSDLNVSNKSTIALKYYVFLSIESLLLCLIIIYLIQSNLNDKTFKETYDKSSKLAIGLLGSVLLTALLVFGESYIAKNITTTTNNNNPGNMGGSSSNVSYSSSSEITTNETISDKEYSSENKDENALAVSGEIEVSASNITVNKIGDSDGGDNTSFYGTNSAIIAKDGANLTLTNITVNTDANGANGVFSYGGSATTNNTSSDGTTINISDSVITTKGDASGGIMTTGGGITNASNLTITTSGTSSAAIRSDRGGGEVNVDGGTYTTNGNGSPAIYSTADITVKNAKLISNTSEGIVIEGKNYVSIEDVTLVDTNNKLNGQSTTYKNIFLYQSMSGDAETGESEFIAKNSKITTNKGDTLYVTNTKAKITLTNNTIVNNDSDGNFLRIKADSWGNSGSNGGEVTLTMNDQTVSGNIVVDSVSTLDMTMNNSTFKGVINSEKSAKSISLTLDKNSLVTLTGNSYVTSLTNADETNSNIDFNGYKLYVNGKSIN